MLTYMLEFNLKLLNLSIHASLNEKSTKKQKRGSKDVIIGGFQLTQLVN